MAHPLAMSSPALVVELRGFFLVLPSPAKAYFAGTKVD